MKICSEREVVAWALGVTRHGPEYDYPCRLAKKRGAPAKTGVALIETLLQCSAALAREGIRWELRQLPDWTPGNRLSYVYLYLWREGQRPPDLRGWPIAPGRWVAQYRWWLAQRYGWTGQYKGWKKRVAVGR